MADTIRPAAAPPASAAKAEADRQARIKREAAALRENLRKRKQQVRARTETVREPD